MSIQGEFVVYPGGRSRCMNIGTEIADIGIWTTQCDRWHEYHIRTRGDHVVKGRIKKTMSGHGNILHLLRDVLADAAEQMDKLPKDYSTIRTKTDGED